MTLVKNPQGKRIFIIFASMSKKQIAVLTGAGISAESGISTFRDSGGLWEKHDLSQVATPTAWAANPQLVLEFYNQRRRQVMEAKPNAAHKALVELETAYTVDIITQNIDDLHERAGSTRILHLHGELLKVRSTKDPSLIYHWPKDLHWGDKCELGSQLRPHIVWFGEEVPLMPKAAEIVAAADFVLVIGSSMQVYPAAGLVGFAPPHARVYYIDPKPSLNYELQSRPNLRVLAEPASSGLRKVVDELLNLQANS